MDPDREIRNLLSRYNLLWDERRYDDWIELFEADATFDWRGRQAGGRDAIQALIGRGNGARPAEPGFHVMANTLVETTGPRGTAVANFLFVVHRPTGYECAYAGRTYDRVLRGAAGWRFESRAVRFLGDEPPAGW